MSHVNYAKIPAKKLFSTFNSQLHNPSLFQMNTMTIYSFLCLFSAVVCMSNFDQTSPSCTLFTLDLDTLLDPIRNIVADLQKHTEDLTNIQSFSQATTTNGLRTVVSTTAKTFEKGFEFCSNRNSRMIEPTPAIITAIKAMGMTNPIWVDVYTPTSGGHPYYRSNQPLITNLGGSEGTPPTSLATGKCVTYDTQSYKFETVDCTAEHMVLCQEV